MGLIICKGAIQALEVLILFFLCFCLNFSIAISTITLNQPISDPESIISGNGTFELGFFSLANTTNRYVGIWFGKIPVRTVVWVANRDRPLNDSSGIVTISQDGNLIVLNRQKEVIWSSNVSNSVANSSAAQLLDSGNLILRDKSTGNTIWESFQHPSDSFISKMRLSRMDTTLFLKSWRSPSDPSDGGFNFGVSPFAITESFTWNGSRPYWRSGPWNGRIFIGIPVSNPLNLDGLYDVNNNEGTVDFTYIIPNESFLLYYVLNHKGTLMEKFWNEGKKEWEVTWSVPGNECDVYGKCGPFGSCNPKDSPICSCLKGFEPNHAEEWNNGNFTGGCVRRTPLQCERNGNSSHNHSKQDRFLKLTTMKVPVFAEHALVLQEECENQCLMDCSCAAYAYYTGIGCMLWRRSLIDIQKFSSHGADLYIRVANSELDKNRNMKVVIAVSVIIGSIIVAICAYFSWMWIFKQRGMKKKKSEMLDFSTQITSGDAMNRTKLEELPLFKFEKLAIATDQFHVSNKLGQGGFGPVYKGKLPDGQEIAVKRLSRSSKQGLEEFMNEVVVISKLQHRNLVRLLGCCVEGEESMLIYEYMPNKSLDAFLFDPHKQELLDWRKRLNIIEGIGRGLLYLHRDSRLRIIHRDLKASNILLDKELLPKISDFGIARIFGGNEDQANTRRVVGTYGYMAPEYAMQGRFSEKSDVFSFGVLLLEIVSGRKNNSFYNDEQAWSLLGYAWKLWNEDNIVPLVDSTIYNQDFHLETLRCIHIGLLCVQEFAVDRPTISAVLSMLSSEIAYLAKPKQPAFTQRPNPSQKESSQQRQNGCSTNDVTVTIIEGR